MSVEHGDSKKIKKLFRIPEFVRTYDLGSGAARKKKPPVLGIRPGGQNPPNLGENLSVSRNLGPRFLEF